MVRDRWNSFMKARIDSRSNFLNMERRLLWVTSWVCMRESVMAGKPLPLVLKPRFYPRRLPNWFELPSRRENKLSSTRPRPCRDNRLHTVCEEARCPNIHECWASGDAAFVIAGQECTWLPLCAVGTIKRPPPLTEGPNTLRKPLPP